jgi:hypothetical protein
MTDKMELLIEILLDRMARDDLRDDAAMDLADYKHKNALDALTQIASDPNEDRMVVNSCAESISEICVGMGYFDEQSFKRLIPFAQKIVFGYIVASKPELISEPLKTELVKKFNH